MMTPAPSPHSRRQRLLLPLLLLLSACTPVSEGTTPTRAAIAESSLPPMKTFGAPRPGAVTRSNVDLARDFLDLSFQLESGRELAVFSRFEAPITLRVTGAPPATLGPDLSRLIARLRTEAGVVLTPTTSPDAGITIQAVPRRAIQRVLPQAACFVAPNVRSLSEYSANRRNARTNWTRVEIRTHLTIFVPNDTSPQEVRDCLHEELAQALGPLNDLYRLPDSVFNDDNVHTVLTGFDMLMLRATYAPELHSGMSRAEVEAQLPGIFARINPPGNVPSRGFVSDTPLEWSQAIATALGPGAGLNQRTRAANQAVSIAISEGWQDQRRAFAHYAKARVLQSTESEAARRQYELADTFYARSPETRLHRAYVASQLAAYAISDGQPGTALNLTAPYVDAAIQSENASLLATLLLLRAEALDLEGRTVEARAVRLDSLGWARYGFGPDWAVRAKQNEITSLTPQAGRIPG